MRRLLTLLAVLPSLVLFSAAAAGQPAEGEDPAVRAARMRQEAVKTLEVRFKRSEVIVKGGLTLRLPARSRPQTPAPAKETTLESTNRLVLDRDKVRFENNHLKLQRLPNNTVEVSRRGVFVGSFDGITIKMLFPHSAGGMGPPAGHVAIDTGGKILGFIDTVPIEVAYRGFRAMHARPWLDQLQATGVSTLIDGSLCQGYKPGGAHKNVPLYWLDPVKDYVFRRREQEKGRQIIDVQYRNDKTIGWVPTKWVRKEYGPEGDLLSTITIEVLEMAFNNPQPPEQFSLVFPPGAYVNDHRTAGSKQYLVQADGSLRWLPGPGEEEEPRGAWFEIIKWSLAGLAAILLARGFTYLWQKKRIIRK
jgi:hypothetical protein